MNSIWCDVFQMIEESPRNRKKRHPRFDLKRSSRPSKNKSLAGKAISAIKLPDGGYDLKVVPITFSEAFVSHVGLALGMGISPTQTAMIVVARWMYKPETYVVAAYRDLLNPALLWREKEYPEWLTKK